MKKTAWKRTLGILLAASICLPNISVLAAGAAEGESAIMEEQNSVEDIRTVNESENSGFAEDKTFEIVQENVNEQTVENTDSEKGDRANSWRYKDGELLPSILRGEQYRTWPTDIPGAVGYGIDVSEHQGIINWQKVKAAGVDYAIVRCGYGMNLPGQDDDYWYKNADACEQYGIPFGAYLYSYADSIEKAKSEAEHVLRLVNGYNLSYPIYYDLEESSVRSKLSSSQIADIAETFCRIIEDAGYEVAIYANTDWFTNYLTDSRFDQWDKWVAQYNDICTYTGEYSMWQCSSKGIVDGIAGDTDLNIDLGAYVGGNSVDGRRIVKSGGKIYGYEGAYKLYGAQKILKYWYYFDKSKDGAAHIGWRTDGTKTYYYDENGRLAQGAKKIGSYWYYFAGNGTMYTGWRTDGTKTYYYDENGCLAQGAKKIESYWYYFAGNGNMYTGWRTDGTKTYYYDENGRLAQGAKKIGSYWYYFSGNGNMYVGWRTDGSKTYYYDNEGRLSQGAKKIGSYWYYFAGNGTMYTGWRTDGTKTYYYDENGRLAQGAKKIGSYWYYFAGNGTMYTGWRTDGTKTYYYDKNGRLAQKAAFIDGRWYNFKSNGELIG